MSSSRSAISRSCARKTGRWSTLRVDGPGRAEEGSGAKSHPRASSWRSS